MHPDASREEGEPSHSDPLDDPRIRSIEVGMPANSDRTRSKAVHQPQPTL